MKFKEIKKRITALLVLATFTLSSIPVYAEVEEGVVIVETSENEDISENNDSGEDETGNLDENSGDESSNDTQVLEVTVTLLSDETPEETTEESLEVNSEETTEESLEVNSEETTEESLEVNSEETTDETTELTQEANPEETQEVVPEQAGSETKNGETSEQTNLETTNVETTEQATVTENNSETIDEEAVTENNTEASSDNISAADSVNASTGSSADNNSLNGQLMTEEFKSIKALEENAPKYSKTIEGVSTSQSSTGRYNVSFIVNEKNEITGEEKKFQYTVGGFKDEDDIQDFLNYIPKSQNSSSDTRYSNPNLIDAEKKMWEYSSEIEINPDADPNDDYDAYLCWAGALSDMLVLSGWNNADSIVRPDGVSFSDEDDIFDYFAHNFTDCGGNQTYGISWFFSGINYAEGYEGWSQLKNEEGYSSPLLKDYCAQDMNYNQAIYKEEQLGDLLKYLDYDSDGDRCTLGLIVGYYKNDNEGNRALDENGNPLRVSGHCVTIIGYSTDENGLPASIILIDPDSYNNDNVYIESSKDNDERAYKNTYTSYPVRYIDGNWHLMNYYEGPKYDVIIDEIGVLKYYSDNTKNRLEQGGTKDLINNVDLWNYILATCKPGDDDNDCYSFYEGEGINLYSVIENFSNVCVDLGTNTIAYTIEIIKDGSVISSNNYSLSLESSDLVEETFFHRFINDNVSLDPGEYTVNLILNPDRSITEAYYNNNSKGVKFVVIKSVDENGNEHYEVVEVEENDANSENEQTPISNSVTDLFDYSFVEEQTDYINNPLKKFHFMFKGGFDDLALTEADLANAEVIFNYSVAGSMAGSGINFSSNISITKDDYSIVKNADGTISIVFSNEFMKKLPKGVHYFKMLIGGKVRTFKVEIK